ncbi:MAG: M1 family metallopeptidase [Arachidicoccus sp.]|nr:M1 family metallopeptidase [Arachidicoccus sp.]
MKKVYLCLSLASLISTAFTQTDTSKYNHNEAFAPGFYTYNGNEYRSAKGAPGASYWQNKVDYNIDVKLDTSKKRIDGSVQINYTNNSPDNLSYLWLYVEQNIYREDSRAEATADIRGNMKRYAAKTFTQGDEIKSVSITINGKTLHPKYTITDTRMQILLPEELKAKGGKLQINIDYGFDITEKGTDRMGRMNTKNGWIYELAQWYPRMCVYDDIEGWNTLPYLGAGEFYLEYGNINYTITAPSDLVIVGSGVLQNPSEVLTAQQQQKLAQAKNSDAAVTIHSLQDVQSGKDKLNKAELTWKFQCNNTRDVAWAASRAFIWDAARIKMQSGKIILGQSVYPEESKPVWDSSTYFTQQSIAINSMWCDFPYPVATNVAGIVGGMEYPGIVFCEAKQDSYKEFWFVTEHEFGHNWFPMLVGSNERKYAWMDEGFNTFTNYVTSRIFENGGYNNEPDKYKIAKRFFSGREESLMTIPDVVQPYTLADVGYYKPAVGLLILRDVILGHDRFDFAFKQYIKNWSYKHPAPYDFFHAMDNASGEDLSWFWRGWFYNTWVIDQSVNSVKYNNEDTAKGALITIENIGQMPLPIKLKIDESNGKTTEIQLPVEIWQRGSKWTFKANTTSAIKQIIIDPKHEYPDVNPDNNVWIK